MAVQSFPSVIPFSPRLWICRLPDPVFKVYFGEDQGERMISLRPVLLLVFTGLLCWRSICCRHVSVRLSQAGIVSKRLNAESRKQRHAIAQGLQFSDARDLREIRPGSPHRGAPNAGGVG